MNGQGITQIVVYSIVLIVLGYPLGIYMAKIYTAERLPLGSLERGFLRLVGNAREQIVASVRDVGSDLQRPVLRCCSTCSSACKVTCSSIPTISPASLPTSR